MLFLLFAVIQDPVVLCLIYIFIVSLLTQKIFDSFIFLSTFNQEFSLILSFFFFWYECCICIVNGTISQFL